MSNNPSLRAEAEARLASKGIARTDAPADGAMLHELQVHQIELEMQNEELRRTHAELEEARDRYVNLYDFAPVGYLTLSRMGLIDEINLAGAAMLGMERAQLLNRRFAKFVAPQDKDRWYRASLRLLKHSKEDTQSIELEMAPANAPHFHAHLNCVIKPVGEQPAMLRIALSDVTESKNLQAKLVAQNEHAAEINAELAEANQELKSAKSQLLQTEKLASIGLLAAGVAHEINNPVGYVNSNLGTLEKYLLDIFAVIDKYEAALPACADNPLLEELRQFKAGIDFNHTREDTKALIAECHQGLGRVKKIVLDLKDFAHAGADEQWVWADVHQGLESTLCVVWNELKYKCEVKKEYGELPQIYCLPPHLNQVFMNLLVNAAQAIDEHGIVTLRTGQEGDQVWIEVADTGKGIAPENLVHIFDPFFTTKPVGKGTGLGLSVSYSIVEKHHGRIEIQSEVGKGTTMRVWLPVNSAQAATNQ